MKKGLAVSFLCASLACLSWAGKKYTIQPNSPEEKALFAARTEQDPAKRITQLDAFLQKFPQSAAAAYPHHLSSYVELKQWDKALEYGQKAYEADDEDPEIPSNHARAALGKGDRAAAVQWGAVGGALLNSLLSAPKPADTDEDDWKRRQEGLQNEREQLEYYVLQAITQEADAPRRIQLLDQFTKVFSGTYAKRALAAYAMAYQQLGDLAKMTASAEKAVEVEPENEAMHLLLGEIFLGQKRLDEAIQHAQLVVKIMEAKTRPENVPEADWTTYVNNYRGAARSIVGRALMLQEKTTAAVPELKAAADLLADPQALAPVLYNLGFAYAKQKQLADARAVLNKAVLIPGPYQKLTKELLAKVQGR